MTTNMERIKLDRDADNDSDYISIIKDGLGVYLHISVDWMFNDSGLDVQDFEILNIEHVFDTDTGWEIDDYDLSTVTFSDDDKKELYHIVDAVVAEQLDCA